MSSTARGVRAARAEPARRPARRATPAPPPKPRRHLRVVRAEEGRHDRRLRFAFVTGMFIVVASVFGLVAFNVFLVQSQFRLEHLEDQVDSQRSEYERLRLEAAELSSPERILAIARDRLHMVEPPSVTALTVPVSGEGYGPVDGDPAARAWAEVKPYLAAEP